VEIHDHSSCAAYVCPLDSPGIRAAAEALEKGFGKAPLYIREGGSLPILPMFKKVLGAESLMMGFCLPEANIHGPNEMFGLDDFHNGAKTSAYFMDLLGKQAA
jgi:acetylornithine deacetylase/succinyl-diaminopimelate desuccinylase-like protein